MRNVSFPPSEANQPQTCRANTGLSDTAELDAYQQGDQFDEAFYGYAPTLPTWEDVQQLADRARDEDFFNQDNRVEPATDVDSDFLDYIGSGKLNALIDAAGTMRGEAMLIGLRKEREIYRQQFAPRNSEFRNVANLVLKMHDDLVSMLRQV